VPLDIWTESRLGSLASLGDGVVYRGKAPVRAGVDGGDRDDLIGGWVHAHEEDDENGQVYRPAGAELPPSRGRQGLELRADGTLVESVPGPVDVPESSEGTWSLEGDELVLSRADGTERRLRVVSAEPERLVLSPSG
jgi:hypothetical protein